MLCWELLSLASFPINICGLNVLLIVVDRVHQPSKALGRLLKQKRPYQKIIEEKYWIRILQNGIKQN